MLAMTLEPTPMTPRPKARGRRKKPPLGPWQTGTAVLIVLVMLGLVALVTWRTGEIPAQYAVPLLLAALWSLLGYQLPVIRAYLRGEEDGADVD